MRWPHGLYGAAQPWAQSSLLGCVGQRGTGLGVQGPGLGVALQTAWGRRAWDSPKGHGGILEPPIWDSPSVRPGGPVLLLQDAGDSSSHLCVVCYPKVPAGCSPEQQESHLVFLVLPGRAGRAVPEPGCKAEHPAKPKPLSLAMHGAAQRSRACTGCLSGGCDGLRHSLGMQLGLSW